MTQSQKDFKKPPRKYQPKGISVIYEDRDILVVEKESGLLSVSRENTHDKTAHSLLNDYVKKGNSKSKNRVYIVHRLDKNTSGTLVLAKSVNAKHYLQDNWEDFEKTYYAVVLGRMEEKEGLITTYLAENQMHKMYTTMNRQKGRLARTEYRVLQESKSYSLLEVKLLTGRKNQIRVHLADAGCPVAGDNKYGEKNKAFRRLCLHAAKLTILHPHSYEKMTFEAPIPDYFNFLLKH